MTREDQLRTDDELDRIGERLRAVRPELSSIELDAVQQRVRSRAARKATGGEGLMKSRIAILMMLVAGMLFSTTGAGLAITGLAGNDQASVAQYDEDDQGEDEGNEVAGEQDEGGNEVAGEQDTAGGGEVQPARQAQFDQSAGGQLPFTGFAALPVLLFGVALLTAGLVLRRRGTA